MNYCFKNIGNLDETSIDISPNLVNIKYGFNGIGKSTIIKSIKYLFGDKTTKQSLENIISSFRKNEKMVLPRKLKSTYHEAYVYDKKYFDSLFSKEDLLNDSYEMFVKSDSYEKNVESITFEVKKILDQLNKTNYINLFQLISLNEGKEIIFKKKKKVIKGQTILYYYSSQNVKFVPKISKQLKPYEGILNSQYRSEWYKWLQKADSRWAEETRKCPYCSSDIDSNILSNNISKLIALKSKTEYNGYDKEQDFINTCASLIKGKLSKDIQEINNLKVKTNLTNTLCLKKGFNFLKKEFRKISFILSLDTVRFIDYKEKNWDELAKQLKRNKLNKCLNLRDNNNKYITSKINNLIDCLLKRMRTLKAETGKLNSYITDLIKDNNELFNNFFDIAGIPYSVKTEHQGNKQFCTYFSYKGNANIISNQLNYLSFGEANAIALLIFCLSVKTKDSALIVLDDPVSSFDNNKRYAIFDYIFRNCRKPLLWNKTCLIFTHDFNTLLVFSQCYPLSSQKIATYSYLSLSDHKLIESKFEPLDITNTLSIYKKIVSDRSRPAISRIVAARHYCESILGKDSLEYHMLSSLTHKINWPFKDCNRTNSFSLREKNTAENKISKLFNIKFNYSEYYKKISNVKKMKQIYFSSISKFDKFCIARVLLDNMDKKNIKNNIVYNFICETYHIENDSLFSIGNIETLDVPDYIISICDDLVTNC